MGWSADNSEIDTNNVHRLHSTEVHWVYRAKSNCIWLSILPVSPLTAALGLVKNIIPSDNFTDYTTHSFTMNTVHRVHISNA